MDWKTFLAEVIGHLAWPGVAATALLLFRTRLSPLVDRLEELTLGGASARFRQGIAEAEKEKERIRNQPSEPEPPLPSHDAQPASGDEKDHRSIPDPNERQGSLVGLPDGFVELATSFPQLAILAAYRQVEDAIEAYAKSYPKAAKSTGAEFMRKLLRVGLIDNDVYELFNSARKLRNMAAHTDELNVTGGQVVSYWDTCAVLAKQIRDSLAMLSDTAAVLDPIDGKGVD